jgi:prevent-host-death family protein
MAAMVDMDEAVTQLLQLVERAHAGEEIVIAKRGEPWARLVPLTVAATRVPGLLAGSFDEAFFEPLPDDELDG